MTTVGLVGFAGVIAFGLLYIVFLFKGASLKLPVIGLCLTFYLTSVGAYASLTAANFLIFMAAWLVPEVLIANWINQY